MKRLFFFLLLLIAFSSFISYCDNSKEKITNVFLKNHFGLKLENATKITTINKNVFYNLLLETSDSSEALNDMKIFWPYNFECFYDSIFVSNNNTDVTGFVRFFGGDTAWYTIGFYKNLKKDSIWTIIRPTYKEIQQYKSGTRNGEWLCFYPNGQMAFRKKWYMNQILDTVFNWYPNGNIKEFEVWEKGESVQHECFNEKGDPIECESD